MYGHLVTTFKRVLIKQPHNLFLDIVKVGWLNKQMCVVL
jgi:hypothetical protein